MKSAPLPLKILAFDVFGTVVDWHGSIARAIDEMALGVDGAKFAHLWRAGYVPAMKRVATGELGWMKLDDLHRMILDALLERFQICSLTEQQKIHLNTAWHRLAPWPDSRPGLIALKSRYTLCTLSNGNISLLTALSKQADLPWDCILSAEIFERYKPAPETYRGVARIFNVQPEQVMLVATHKDDLDAARSNGLRTAYIERPMEYGALHPKDETRDPANDFHATSIEDLARQLRGLNSKAPDDRE